MIRAIADSDCDAVTRIYNHYITDTIITFEEEPITAAEIASRVQEVLSSDLPWIVAEEGGEIVGYAYASKWKSRAAYRFSVETTVYLGANRTRGGWGTKLYSELFDQLRARGIHAAIGGIALPNEASIALHEKFGMEKVAHFPEVGFKFGRWIDVGYWQIIF